jgi:hypothetical protein
MLHDLELPGNHGSAMLALPEPMLQIVAAACLVVSVGAAASYSNRCTHSSTCQELMEAAAFCILHSAGSLHSAFCFLHSVFCILHSTRRLGTTCSCLAMNGDSCSSRCSSSRSCRRCSNSSRDVVDVTHSLHAWR